MKKENHDIIIRTKLIPTVYVGLIAAAVYLKIGC